MANPHTDSANPLRWIVRRKAEVIDAVRRGELSFADACERYNLSADELLSWQDAYRSYGREGLCAMRVRMYRPSA